MNTENNTLCFTKSVGDEAKYNISVDWSKNSVLTGDGSNWEDGRKTCTIEEIEVFLVE